MSKRMIERAVWIAADRDCDSPVFRREFTASKTEACRLEITGLGYFYATVNGRAISTDRLVPAQSDYEKRDLSNLGYPTTDTFGNFRIYFLEYDISPLLNEGKNVLEIQLGNGWYWQNERKCEGELSYGKTLKTAFGIEHKDKNGHREILSDGSEVWRESNLIYNNIFIGETVDLRIDEASLPQYPVAVLPRPDAALCEQKCPPDRIIRTVRPTLLNSENGRCVYDAGENISGIVRVTVSAESGTEVTLRFAEKLKDGEIDPSNIGGTYTCRTVPFQVMTDRIICNGERCVYEPKFVWHAFRYFEVCGPVDELEVLVMHTDVAITSEFKSSNETLNWLYDTFIRTQLNNMHGGVPMDCPHRERLGYTGDGQLCAETAMLTLDSREFYRKWIRDVLDCQDTVGGHIQHTAPFMGGGGGPGGWGCAVVIVPWCYYKMYGEKQMLSLCFEPMDNWLGYMLARSENDLVVREEEGGWCLGDWCTFDNPPDLPIPFVNTYFAVKCMDIFCETAEILGKTERIQHYRDAAQKMREAICRDYYNSETGSFCDGIQGADAFALDIGLGDERTLLALKKKYSELEYFDTGIFGTLILLEVLLDNGLEDIAFDLLTTEKLGSFAYMKNQGATTLWEGWQGTESLNHPMIGACVKLLFSRILGIRQSDTSSGFEKIDISPIIPKELDYADGYISTCRGDIRVGWKKQNGQTVFDITLPEGVTAEFRFKHIKKILNTGKQQIII